MCISSNKYILFDNEKIKTTDFSFDNWRLVKCKITLKYLKMSFENALKMKETQKMQNIKQLGIYILMLLKHIFHYKKATSKTFKTLK